MLVVFVVPSAFAIVTVVMALVIALTHPIFLHKVNGLAAGTIATAVLTPLLLVLLGHIQVYRLLVNRCRRLYDHHWLWVDDARLWECAYVYAPINAWLVDADRYANVSLRKCG